MLVLCWRVSFPLAFSPTSTVPPHRILFLSSTNLETGCKKAVPFDMMHLQDFPNEILTKIFSQIAGYSAFELSTLSRFFYKLMRPIIYQRKINICFGDPEITFQSSWLQRAKNAQPPRAPDTTYRCLLLLRSVKENPDIGPLIAEVEFQWEVVLEEINSVEMANQLLKTLPNLKTLVIQAKRWQISIDSYPHFLEVNSMLMLKDVTLFDKQLTTNTVNRYLSLPHLQKLAIRCGLNGSYEEVDETLHNSSLRVLDLSGGYHTRAEIVHAIFKSHSKITSFYGTLFGTEKYSEYSRTSGYIASLLSPVEISDTMAPLQNSLERLELQLCVCKWIDRGHDGTRMDLSMMNNLRILQCPSKCFFPPQVGGVAPSRAGLYKLLPPNLEELTVSSLSSPLLEQCTNGIISVAI